MELLQVPNDFVSGIGIHLDPGHDGKTAQRLCTYRTVNVVSVSVMSSAAGPLADRVAQPPVPCAHRAPASDSQPARASRSHSPVAVTWLSNSVSLCLSLPLRRGSLPLYLPRFS